MCAEKISGGATLGPEYGSPSDPGFRTRYLASCHCDAVRYEVAAAPVAAKICHCRDCRMLHGAPMQWAAIFHKRDVRLTGGSEHLAFYSASLRIARRELPCKLRCNRCGTPIADEGRRMWLAFPELFDFGSPRRIPAPFQPTCHIFYAQRVVDVDDGLPKWSAHENESALL